VRRVAAIIASCLRHPRALAHGIGGRKDLPSAGFFLIGAAVVLLVSFRALAVLWPAPRLRTAAAAGEDVAPWLTRRRRVRAGVLYLVVAGSSAMPGVATSPHAV
jgi:hypothetical protein